MDLKRKLPTEPVLEIMERNGNRLLNLINQLLDLSKLEANQLNPQPEPGDLAVFLWTLTRSFSSLAESRRIQFSFTQNADSWWTEFDHDRIEKIVTNLLSNAIKFTPPGKQVQMRVDYPLLSDSAEVRISVDDTGIGIAPDQLPHIFERFYQRSSNSADGQMNRAYEGTGIGLALVKELVRVLGGQVSVTSTLGEGTTFTIGLPMTILVEPAGIPLSVESKISQLALLNLPASISDLAVSTTSVQPSTENSLLIIDDNADIRTYVRHIFENEYQIIEAVDGVEGLERVTEMVPDIVICDLMMPRLDGFGFCRALKTQEATSHIPVVMLTAKTTPGDRITGFELGADDYLTKPFNQAELRARVRNLIEKQQRLFRRIVTDNSIPLPTKGTAEAVDVVLPVSEQKFLDRLSVVVQQHLSDPDFSVEMLAEGVNMSRTQLHRKLKAVTNLTATLFIRDIRLAKAAELLHAGEYSVTQVAYAVGLDNLSYFARVFQERYGVLPSQYGKSATAPINSQRNGLSKTT